MTEENDRLRGTLVQVIKGLGTLRHDLSTKKLDSLKEMIYSNYRQQDQNVGKRIAALPVKIGH